MNEKRLQFVNENGRIGVMEKESLDLEMKKAIWRQAAYYLETAIKTLELLPDSEWHDLHELAYFVDKMRYRVPAKTDSQLTK